jgi:hypothetical protein
VGGVGCRAHLAFGALPGLSAPVSAPAATEGLESAISVGRGWARFVRYPEVGRIQQMTEKGGKQNGGS